MSMRKTLTTVASTIVELRRLRTQEDAWPTTQEQVDTVVARYWKESARATDEAGNLAGKRE